MIFYLSGTGNTKWAAMRLAEITGDVLTDVSKVPEGIFQYELKPDERIGFCFPVHGWRPPLILRNFIKRLRMYNSQRHFCYALCTAGDTVGEAMDIMEFDLDCEGMYLECSISLIMPESYVGLPFMDVDTPEAEKRKIAKAAADLERFAVHVVNREKGVKELTVGRWPKINSRIIGGLFTKCLITDKPFKVTPDKCIRCGKCAAACPVGNVSWSKGELPGWKHNGTCLSCFSCYHHCPVHAIEYGRRTSKKGQYYFGRN